MARTASDAELCEIKGKFARYQNDTNVFICGDNMLSHGYTVEIYESLEQQTHKHLACLPSRDTNTLFAYTRCCGSGFMTELDPTFNPYAYAYANWSQIKQPPKWHPNQQATALFWTMTQSLTSEDCRRKIDAISNSCDLQQVRVHLLDMYPTQRLTAAERNALLTHFENWTRRYCDPIAQEYHENTEITARYPMTGRPKTWMLSLTKNTQIPDASFSIPVVRYTTPNGVGIYAGEAGSGWDPNEDGCSTFYYYEPNSAVRLTVQLSERVLYAANKMHAVWLFAQHDDVEFVDPLFTTNRLNGLPTFMKLFVDKFRFSPSLHAAAMYMCEAMFDHNERRGDNRVRTDQWDAQFAGDFGSKMGTEMHFMRMLTFKDACADAPSDPTHMDGLFRTRDCAYNTYMNDDGNSSLYGEFDALDSVLARAKQSRWDIIVLQSEHGKTRPVTEVMDLRPREESYASLVVGVENSGSGLVSSKYPTVWFRE